MKTSILLYVIVSIIFAFSCGKDSKTITISGLVKDPMQNKAVSGAKIIISANRVSGGIFSNTYEEIASGKTDANGKYTIEINQENVAGYRFNLLTTNYFDYQEDVKTVDINDKKSVEKNFNQFPESTIRMHIENLIPSSASDQISFRFQNADQNCSKCCNSTYMSGLGANYNQTIECKVVGNRYLVFDYTITQSGNHTYVLDSVFMDAFQIKEHSVFY